MTDSDPPTGLLSCCSLAARSRLAGGLILLALAHAPGAMAQGAPSGGGGRPPPGSADEASVPAATGSAADMDRLYTALALQPPQMGAWRAYVGRVDAYLQLYYRQQPVQPSGVAPRQVARVVDRLQNQLAAVEDIEQAVKALYAQLTPPQQQQADRLLLDTLPAGLRGVVTVAAAEGQPQRSGGPGGRSGGGGGGMPPGGGGSF